MKQLYSKLLSTSLLNAFGVSINFFTNFIIIKTLSIEIFGEFVVFTSYLAFLGLLYELIPTNFSVFKLQDNFDFKFHLIRFFIVTSFLIIVALIFLKLFFFSNISLYLILLFSLSTYSLNFFNITFQASGKIENYFWLLLILSILKFFMILIFHYFNFLNSLSSLLLSISLAQFFILFSYSFYERNNLKLIFSSPNSFIDTYSFIIQNFHSFKPYYLNTFLKRVRENSIILIFSRLVSIETLGLFSLFLKIDSFVLGLARNFETIFMNRNNSHIYRKLFIQKVGFLGIFLQILYFVVGVLYMKIIVDKFYYFEIFIQSILVYPYIHFLLARSDQLSKFNNEESNISEVFYVLIVVLISIIGMILKINSIYFILTAYIFAKLGSHLYMIFKSKSIF
jgi:hypothetical protein